MDNSAILRQVRTRRKEIAITFDDGPNADYTPAILTMLSEVSGKATFYMIGEQIEANPDVVRAVDKEGHEIGNHTYSHPYLTRISPNECRQELKRTDTLIRKLTGKRPLTFRPPYLDYNEEVIAISKGEGYQMIGALNTETRDWEQPGADYILDKSLAHIGQGNILLFHDGYGDRSQTLQAFGRLLGILDERGYRLVTVSEMLASDRSE
ncbi:polysaccharide deacetylase family protein [Cohnella mopanensis]|uniref:polysaccharide deacetylase family protein n=1 Tax=Cohnella mopanensis TaxID=2911966 RepID=UPI001EF8540F|nr:polysaccharide deacetylase family protein [Cohnella mopanensis]